MAHPYLSMMDPLDPTRIAEIRARLLSVFDAGRRDMPWRDDPDPYRVLVSEMMLQQTRVETVFPYFRRWMERFPELETLADADLDEVVTAWAGLGYYARARNLHRAARMVRERFGGEIPDTVDDLRTLPGVGEYTAGAVASIAYGVAAPAVDGNVRRVLSRLLDLERPTPATLRNAAAQVVDPGRPGDFNQAMMEFGATVCTPAAPVCSECPLQDLCIAFTRDTVAERPAPRAKRAMAERTFAVAVCVRKGEVGEADVGESPSLFEALLCRRPPEGLLGGMWEFPGAEVGGEEASPELVEHLRRELAPLGVCRVRAIDALPSVGHTFSHFRAAYLPFLFECEGSDHREAAGHCPSQEVRWVRLHELDRMALPAAQRKIAALARESL